MASRRVAAVDLGAGSGRVAVGAFDGELVTLELVHRFTSHPLWLPDGLHWNLPQLFADILDGLAAAARPEPLDGIGIDSWGCDYALLDGEHRVLGLPYHYRDPARATVESVERAHARVDRHELYARTGIQTMPINTVFQLVAEAERPVVRAAEHIALIPDLIGLWLTGSLANEVTAASSTGLLEARGMRWARDLVERLGLPAAALRRGGRRARSRPRPGAGRPCRGRPGRGHGRAHRGRTRHGKRVRGHAARLGRCRGPLLGHVVAARARARRPGARPRGRGLQPHQRTGRRRHHAATAQRDGHVARRGMPARMGRGGHRTAVCGAPAGRRRRHRDRAVRSRRPVTAAPRADGRPDPRALPRRRPARARRPRGARPLDPRLPRVQVPPRPRTARARHAAAAWSWSTSWAGAAATSSSAA